MGGGPELFTVEYEPSGGKAVASGPFLKAGAWQKLALVVTKERTALYHDGKHMGELPGRASGANWSSHLQTTWHRRLSLFGVGRGGMGLVPESSGYHWKGQVRSVRVARRALSAIEVAKE